MYKPSAGYINYVSIKPLLTVTRTQCKGRLKFTMETELRRQKRTVCKRVRTITIQISKHCTNLTSLTADELNKMVFIQRYYNDLLIY
jgi:hypothetical protein